MDLVVDDFEVRRIQSKRSFRTGVQRFNVGGVTKTKRRLRQSERTIADDAAVESRRSVGNRQFAFVLDVVRFAVGGVVEEIVVARVGVRYSF